MLIGPASNLQTRRRFDPRQISGLGLWLDASDASTITIATGVSQWNDKSGNGRNFAQATGANQPAQISAGLNGRNTIRGDGSNDVLICTTNLAFIKNVGGATLVAVRKWVTSPATPAAALFVSSGASNQSSRAALNGGNTANKSVVGGRRLDGDGFASVASTANVGAGFELQMGLLDYTNSNADQYINGTVDGTTTTFQTDGSTSNTDSLGLAVFANAGGTGNGNVEFAEAMIWEALLSTTHRQQVEGYLAHKWGLASSLPSTHPYRFAAP